MCRNLNRAIVFILFAGILLIVGGCERSYSSSVRPKSPAQPAGAPRRVKTVRVSVSALEQIVNAFGSLAAVDRTTLSAKVPGRLLTLNVDLGSVVKQGDLIAQIEPKDYQLQVQQSEALLAQARVRLGLSIEGTNDITDFEQTSTVRQTRAVLDEAVANRDRVLKLSKQGILSTSDVDTTEAAYRVALSRYEDAVMEVRNRQALAAQRRAELEIARQQLVDTTLISPYDGVVEERRANLGEYLVAGTPMVTIVRMDPLRLRLDVPEREAANIHSGQKVRLRIEGNTNVYTGEIKRLSPAIEEHTRMLRVEADVTNPGELRPGSFTKAEIVTDGKAKAVLIPSSAVTSFAGIEKAFVIREGKAVERPVTTGRRITEKVEVLDGIEPGDVLIIEPGDLQSGNLVDSVD